MTLTLLKNTNQVFANYPLDLTKVSSYLGCGHGCGFLIRKGKDYYVYDLDFFYKEYLSHIQSFILYIHSWILFYYLRYNTVLIWFIDQIVPGFIIGKSFRLVLCFFLKEHFLTFCQYKISQNICILPSTVLDSTISVRNNWFSIFSVELWKYMMFTNPWIHISHYLYICIDIKINMSSYWYLQLWFSQP